LPHSVEFTFIENDQIIKIFQENIPWYNSFVMYYILLPNPSGRTRPWGLLSL
jgi:hypothetical protein